MKKCTQCHQELPFVSFSKDSRSVSGVRSECKQCQNIRQIAYLKTEKGKLSRRKYHCSEKGKAADKKSEQALLGKERMSRYRKSPKGKDSLKKRSARYYQTDKGKLKLINASHRRRLSGAGAVSSLTLAEWNDIKRLYKYKCVYCGEKKHLTMDHVIPISKGGLHTKGNILPACQSCNSVKGNRPVLLQLLVEM